MRGGEQFGLIDRAGVITQTAHDGGVEDGAVIADTDGAEDLVDLAQRSQTQAARFRLPDQGFEPPDHVGTAAAT